LNSLRHLVFCCFFCVDIFIFLAGDAITNEDEDEDEEEDTSIVVLVVAIITLLSLSLSLSLSALNNI